MTATLLALAAWCIAGQALLLPVPAVAPPGVSRASHGRA